MSANRKGPCPWCRKALDRDGGLCSGCFHEYQNGRRKAQTAAVSELVLARERIQELLTIQGCLQEKIRRLETQIRVVSLRAHAR